MPTLKTATKPETFLVIEAFVIPGKDHPRFYRVGEVVAASDPAVRLRPSAFRPHAPRGARVEQATAAPGEVRE